MKIFFTLGKGGTGKTTFSVLISLFFSEKYATEVYSLDKAHNLGDALGVQLKDNLQIINNNLKAAEIDLDLRQKEYLKQVKQKVKNAYSYLTAYNLTGFFDVFEYSPDLEQLTLLLAVEKILSESKAQIIVFDMPPTALAVDMFKSIERNLLWIEKLIDLRKKIKEKKEIISTIKLGKKQTETDKVLKKLEQLHQFYKKIKSRLLNANCFIMENPAKMSQLEAERLENSIKKYGYKNLIRIKNKFNCSDAQCLKPFVFEDIRNGYKKITEDNPKMFEFIGNLI